jgi:UDPglucose 6-dehydrogenase
MKLAVVGTGYVGLVTGVCFAETGNNVVCVDIDKKKIDKLNNGEIPIYEPGLETIYERNVKQGRLHFTTDLESAIEEAKIIFLALPTPPGEDGAADLRYVLKVAEDLSQMIRDYKIIVDKSTVPVGTGERVHAVLAKNLDESLFDVVSNPEFLREGVAVEDFMKPDRVVIGAESEKAQNIMHRLYEPFVRQGNPIIMMDIRSAEMTKYAANSYLATRISFMNEIANLCEKVHANVDMVRIGMGSDTRIGKRFLFPGVGYGGSCFPKDVQALVKTAVKHDYDFRILNSVMEVNDLQKAVLTQKVKKHFNNELEGKNIAIWGLAFKPETDDIREAPALTVIEGLLPTGANISAYDPEAISNVKEVFGDKINYSDDQYEVLIGADALLIITEWSAFRTPSFHAMRELMRTPVIFDGRNLYESEHVTKMGFQYESIGRPTSKD